MFEGLWSLIHPKYLEHIFLLNTGFLKGTLELQGFNLEVELDIWTRIYVSILKNIYFKPYFLSVWKVLNFWVFSGPCFPAFWLNNEVLSVNLFVIKYSEFRHFTFTYHWLLFFFLNLIRKTRYMLLQISSHFKKFKKNWKTFEKLILVHFVNEKYININGSWWSLLPITAITVTLLFFFNK